MPTHSFLDGCTELNLEQETKDTHEILPRAHPAHPKQVLHPLLSSASTNFQQLQRITLRQCFPLGVSKLSATSGPFALHTRPRRKHDLRPLLNTQRARSSLLKDPGSACWQINWSSAPKGLVWKGSSRDRDSQVAGLSHPTPV